VTVPDLIDAVATARLSDRERSILAFEADWQHRAGARHDGGKEEAIRARLGLTPPRYYQLLGRVIDTQAALAYDPMLVARLRRLQESRREQSRARLGGAAPGDRS
jgi:hypothetical protein